MAHYNRASSDLTRPFDGAGEAVVNAGVKLGHVAAQNWATLGLCGTRVMCGGQSCALPI